PRRAPRAEERAPGARRPGDPLHEGDPRPPLRVGRGRVPWGILAEPPFVELEPGTGPDGVEPVLLVDRLAADDGPPAVPPLHEVVEAAYAPDVNGHAADRATLEDHHLGL